MLVIDAHHHWMPREHIEVMDRYLGPGEEAVRDGGLVRVRREGTELFTIDVAMYTSPEEQVKDMDAAGVDMAVLSTGLWQWWNNMELAPTINEELAAVQRRYPDRLIGLAHVPPFDPAAPAELERAVKVLGLRGLCLSTHCQGKYLDDPAYLPLYRKAAELNAPIFVHASPTPVEYASIRVYDAARLLGRVIDQSVAAVRLALSDILDRVPGLTFVIGHLGGDFFLVKDRVTGKSGFFNTPQADFSARLARIYFDSAPAIWTPVQVACAVQTLGSSQVLLGSDYPVLRHWMQKARSIMDGVPMADDEREAVVGGNAARLMGIEK